MTTARLSTSAAQLTASAVLVAATTLLALCDTASAAGSLGKSIPAPEGCAPATSEALDIDELVAARKAAWAADRVERRLF